MITTSFTEQRELEQIKEISIEVGDEVRRATQLHGSIQSLHEAYGIIKEEFDEFWEQVKVNPKKLTPETQQLRLKNLREELIQIAAMCVRTIMDTEL